MVQVRTPFSAVSEAMRFTADRAQIGYSEKMALTIYMAAPEMTAPRLSIEDLAAYPLLVPARGTTPHADIAARFAKTQVRLAPSTNLGAVRQMAKDGLGIACLPEAMVAADLAAGLL